MLLPWDPFVLFLLAVVWGHHVGVDLWSMWEGREKGAGTGLLLCSVTGLLRCSRGEASVIFACQFDDHSHKESPEDFIRMQLSAGKRNKRPNHYTTHPCISLPLACVLSPGCLTSQSTFFCNNICVGQLMCCPHNGPFC